jgi:hypothetical protein
MPLLSMVHNAQIWLLLALLLVMMMVVMLMLCRCIYLTHLE